MKWTTACLFSLHQHPWWGQRPMTSHFYQTIFCWALSLPPSINHKSSYKYTTFFFSARTVFSSHLDSDSHHSALCSLSSLAGLFLNSRKNIFRINKSTGLKLLSKAEQTNQKGKAIIKTRKQAMTQAIYNGADVGRDRNKCSTCRGGGKQRNYTEVKVWRRCYKSTELEVTNPVKN